MMRRILEMVCVIRCLKMETFLYPIALDFRLFVPNNRTFSHLIVEL